MSDAMQKVYNKAYKAEYKRQTNNGVDPLVASAAASEAGKKAVAAAKKENRAEENQATIDAAVAEAVAQTQAAAEASKPAPAAERSNVGRPTASSTTYKVFTIPKGARSVEIGAKDLGALGAKAITITSPNTVRARVKQGQKSIEVGRGSGVVADGVRVPVGVPLIVYGEAGSIVLVSVQS